jgi:DNA-binding HxlR family transcriptional regulator
LKGINSKTLSDRLKELEIHGLIKRKAYAEIPPRVEYSLTKKGTALRKAVLPLMKWAYTYNKTREGKTPCDAAFAEVIGKN